MGTMYSYKSPEGVWYMFIGHIRGASYRIAPDGTYDPKAKAIADDFNNGGHSITIDGVTFKMPTPEERLKQNEYEQHHQNQKTSFWRKIFGY